MRYLITKTLTHKECPWIFEDIPAGTIVYRFYRCTYGTISPDGVAVSFVDDEYPFIEVPKDSVEIIRGYICEKCSHKLGGAAMRGYTCKICNHLHTYGSTAVPQICDDCSYDFKKCMSCMENI